MLWIASAGMKVAASGIWRRPIASIQESRMDPRFAAADAAFRAGREEEGLSLLESALSEAPGPVGAYRLLAGRLFQARRYSEAERWVRAGIERAPKDGDLWNILGVILRRSGRPEEAIEALDRAIKLMPKSIAALGNKLNVLNDMKDGARAVDVGQKLVRLQPANAEYQRGLATAYRNLGQFDNAAARLEMALRLQPKYVDAWLDRAGVASALQNHVEAAEILERALRAVPDDLRLLENQILMLRRGGRYPEAEARLRERAATHPNEAWVWIQLGRTICDFRREEANSAFRRGVDLAPDNIKFRLMLAENLDRSRYGDEGAHIQAAYDTLKDALALGHPPIESLSTARQIAQRVADYEMVDALGTDVEFRAYLARSGLHGPFMQMLGRVRSMDDRLGLLRDHRRWGETIEVQASRNPIVRPPPRLRDGKIRLGFMSSDLRNHPVGYFALPLFQNIDYDRFEIYCYSFYTGEEDGAQKFITSKVKAFRWVKSISDRDAAQMIAEDQLDMLVELGGSTHMNKLEVMAYRPAPIQASWLGYPHSAGLGDIDYLVVDPYIMPQEPRLMIEKPLMLPNAWYPLAPNSFRSEIPIATTPPCVSNGAVTFGTANNPYKYSVEVLDAWARIVAAVPGSRFLFIRPEGGTPAFRENVLKRFAARGVAPNRILFEAVRGAHLPHYNRLDMSLDTFPQTGGTTTCESLWMGAPVVTLVGPSPFERLSYSTLMNIGLGEFCARTVDEYVDIAVKLAADHPRIAGLRAGMRERMQASPIGQVEGWARDFYDTMAEAVEADR